MSEPNGTKVSEMNVQLPRDAVERAVAHVRTKPPTVGSGVGAGNIKSEVIRIRDRHHQIARFVAMNVDRDRICKVMGMTRPRLDMLIDQTPAFAELVVYYEARNLPGQMAQTEEYIDLLERNMIAAEHEIADRLAESPDKLSVSELHKIARDSADRLGFSKQAINLNVNVTLKERLEGLRRRSRGAPVGAGEGKGVVVLRDESLSQRPATPLLELKANSASVGTTLGQPKGPGPTPPTLPAATVPNSDAPMCRDEVLARHRAALEANSKWARARPAPNQEPIKRRL